MIERIYSHFRGAASRRGVRFQKSAIRSKPTLEILEDRCVPSTRIWELPTGSGAPFGIAHRFQRGDLPPDRNIWFTKAGKLGRVTQDGRITEFDIPPGGGPTGLSAGSDRCPPARLIDKLWYTAGNKLGYLAFR